MALFFRTASSAARAYGKVLSRSTAALVVRAISRMKQPLHAMPVPGCRKAGRPWKDPIHRSLIKIYSMEYYNTSFNLNKPDLSV
jgi:hypothetical protein